jgi:branched-chain amino acid transport system substrate-binding protein
MKKGVTVLLCVFLAVFALAGCTGSSQGTDGTIETERQGETGNSNGQDTIKVGFVGPLTGGAAFFGVPASQSIMMAAEEINAAGGVNGQMLEVILEDGQCDGAEAVNTYMKLQSVNDIDAVITMCSPELLALAPVAAGDNVLVISPSATAPSITDVGAHVFRLAPSDALQGTVGAEMLDDAGYEEIGILYINHDYGVGLKDVVSDALGDKIVAAEAFEPDATDFKTQLTKLQDVDAIYLVAFPKEGQIILKQMVELGIDVPIIASEAIKDDVILEVGEGILITVPSSQGNGYEEFAAAYEARFDEAASLFTGESYDVIYVIAEAAKINSDDLVAGMQEVTSYDGVAGFVVFDEFGDIEKPYNLLTIEDGEFVVVE